ncbi:hypothetical protein GMORB2_4824 [Geosmithia morbida]|uniref:Myb-like domain-containing protein n=1 Tax=Geosmithia morbida TaxID=1094350 RepID=A0A9P4YNT8_9HYPO|nr:uncharacterized protein GMORB2_4824 [Geosmithia morbida]KAF4119305.1 hypothetical protein GMORB2_4824 [Geosmithia morbida]
MDGEYCENIHSPLFDWGSNIHGLGAVEPHDETTASYGGTGSTLYADHVHPTCAGHDTNSLINSAYHEDVAAQPPFWRSNTSPAPPFPLPVDMSMWLPSDWWDADSNAAIPSPANPLPSQQHLLLPWAGTTTPSTPSSSPCSPVDAQPTRQQLPPFPGPTSSPTPRSVDAERARRDEFLMRCRAGGMKYRDVKRLGNLPEAESTLRGRYRLLLSTKKKGRSKWTRQDEELLTEAVGRSIKMRKNGLARISWADVVKDIGERGISYPFGVMACRKKWEQLTRND